MSDKQLKDIAKIGVSNSKLIQENKMLKEWIEYYKEHIIKFNIKN